jgi:surface antigen
MWKVDIREITFLGHECNVDDAYRIGNIAQYFRHRTMSFITGGAGESNRRAYTTIGKCFQ